VVFWLIFEYTATIGISSKSSVLERFVPVVVGLAYSMIAGGLLYRTLLHAKVIAHPNGLTIANPFRSDQQIGWDQIASMRADRLLQITTTDGRTVIAWVIQKNGVDRARHRATEADRAIEEMGRLAGRALGTAPKEFARAASA
jgi:hypothetical protein